MKRSCKLPHLSAQLLHLQALNTLLSKQKQDARQGPAENKDALLLHHGHSGRTWAQREPRTDHNPAVRHT